MRALLVLLAVFSITTISASKAYAQPASLEDIMKELEAESKAISLQMADRESNPDSATRSLKMRDLFFGALDFLPKKFEKVKEDEKLAFVRLFDKFLAREIALTSDLVSNFVANDNEKAEATMTEIGKVRREAHKLFK